MNDPIAQQITIDPTMSVAVAVIGYFIGRWLTAYFGLLQRFSIPEAVTGGLVIAVVVALIHSLAGVDMDFAAGNTLILAFFSTVGLNARIGDLAKGGRPFVILLGAAIILLILQDVVGVTLALMFGAPPVLGMMAGSIALVGGHGTASAWAATFDGIAAGASTLGVATATFGLIAGGLVGGPLGTFLISRNDLRPTAAQDYEFSLSRDEERKVDLGVPEVLATFLAIAVAMIIGGQLNALIATAGLKLPEFVTALFAGILIGNIGPVAAAKLKWPMHTPAMALVGGLALNLFLVRAMMSLELWSVIKLAGPLVVVMVCQTALVMLLSYVIVFRLLGSTYDSAIMCSGLVGLSLGATPTAVANMSALTDRFGPSPAAFLVVPLVGASFIDFVNAVVITAGLTVFAP